MTGRTILILFTIIISCTCANGGEKHWEKAAQEAVPAEQVDAEDYNKIGENLQAFLSKNGKPLKGWSFKDEDAKFDGIKMEGEVRKELLTLDAVNHYSDLKSIWNESRSEWLTEFFESGEEYSLCGALDVSDSLDCYVFSVVGDNGLASCFHDAFALLVKDGRAVGAFPLASEGYGFGRLAVSNRISRNTFVISSAAGDLVDEDGNVAVSYYFMRVQDDGTVTRLGNATESDFNKPTWIR